MSAVLVYCKWTLNQDDDDDDDDDRAMPSTRFSSTHYIYVKSATSCCERVMQYRTLVSRVKSTRVLSSIESLVSRSQH